MSLRFFTHSLRWLSMLALVTALGGCFYPEKFTLDVDFHEDGSVDLTFEGKVFISEALQQMQATKQGLSAQQESNMRQIAEALGKRPEFQSAKYLGDGRFQIKAVRSARKDQLLADMPIFGVFRDLSGNTDAVMQTGTNAEPVYKSLGIKPEGVIRIHLPDNAKVVSATVEPSRSMLLFGKRTATWDYKLGAEAKMRLRF
ncbi:hypothetical protein RQP54_17655 [Curvibacter sp. APW13]|uniref:hypothetical protein n=1 Tax=Curvibacter sp. APW13 TaxID=3077236 RepID=UPI0028DE7CC1|nr:hypothetical protein [Curvibacter sp. APW13]MDT8992702.1 hypothetical protein [Curvibacter sp. APW13]